MRSHQTPLFQRCFSFLKFENSYIKLTFTEILMSQLYQNFNEIFLNIHVQALLDLVNQIMYMQIRLCKANPVQIVWKLKLCGLYLVLYAGIPAVLIPLRCSLYNKQHSAELCSHCCQLLLHWHHVLIKLSDILHSHTVKPVSITSSNALER